MGDVLMSGSGKMTSNTAYKAVYGSSNPNPNPKKQSRWKRLWQILNIPIRIRMRPSEDLMTCHAGRRGGMTEIAKRQALIKKLMDIKTLVKKLLHDEIDKC